MIYFAWKAGIADAVLCKAIRDAGRGLTATDPGGGVVKRRMARPGGGAGSGLKYLDAAGETDK
jgi:hypothetical protein